AVPAVDLQRPVDSAVRQLAGVELRLRGGEPEVAALVFQPCRLVDHRAAGLDLRGHVGELELHGLEFRDRLAELLPLLRVGEREVVCALRNPDAHRGDRDATAVEDLEELPESLAAWPEEVR